MLGGQIGTKSEPSSLKTLFSSFPPSNSPLSRLKTLEGLFQLTRRPSRALIRYFRNHREDTVRGATLGPSCTLLPPWRKMIMLVSEPVDAAARISFSAVLLKCGWCVRDLRWHKCRWFFEPLLQHTLNRLSIKGILVIEVNYKKCCL